MMDNPPTTPFMAFPGGLPSLHWVAPLTAIPSGVNGRRGNDAAVILRGEAGMRRVLAAVTLSVVGLYLAYALFDGYFTRAIVGETFAKLGLTGMINNWFETQFPILFAFDSPVRKDRDFFSVFSKNRSEFVVTRIEVTLIISRLNLPPKSKVPLISVAPAAPE